MRKFIEIDGKRYPWRDIVRLRRAQSESAHEPQQQTLFPLHEDTRPLSQRTVAGRFSEPTLFKID